MKKIAFVLFASLFFLSNGFPQGHNQWRGPNRDGHYPETGLLKNWPTKGPEILWHFDGVGEGHSSPYFVGGKIYVTGMLDSIGHVFVLSEEGELLKKFPYGIEFYQNFPGTRTSPVVIGDLLYVLSGQGVLYCMDINAQNQVWSKDMFNDFDGDNLRWGVTENLVIDGDVVYCSPGGTEYNVVALNRFSGDLIWTCKGKGELSAFNSPLLVELQDKKIFVAMMANHILGIDAKTGETLWTHYQPNKWSVHANTPIYYQGGLFCFSGYGQGGVKLKLSPDGSQITKQWFSDSLDNRMGGAVLIDGHIYGSGDNNRKWFCIDWETGETKHSSKEVGKGVVITADGMLYCYSEKGELALVEANPNEFKLISKTKVELGTMQHWAHPVIDKGRLFVRHGNTLIAYTIK